MQDQQFSNHTRYVPGWHILTFFAMLAFLIGACINLSHSAPENLYSASLLCLAGIIFLLVFWYARAFALKAQDRAIRAEENFRHYLLTGKPLPAALRMNQIIALRFAADGEFPSLAQKAAAENLPSKAIKASIAQWRADHHRV